MLTRRIIPCLDVSNGRVVKGVRFQGLRDAGDPVERAAFYQKQRADELVILDVSATPEGRSNQVEVVKGVRQVLAIPLTVGGGVRTVDDAGRLLDAGADKVSANTAAVERPSLVGEIADRFGTQCTVVAIDAKRCNLTDPARGWQVVVRSGKDQKDIDVVAWAEEATSRGAGEILLTSWDRDGTQSGYDLELIRAVSRSVSVPVIASGGASTVEHLVAAFEAGAHAVLAASIFHDDKNTVEDLKRDLAGRGIEVRT